MCQEEKTHVTAWYVSHVTDCVQLVLFIYVCELIMVFCADDRSLQTLPKRFMEDNMEKLYRPVVLLTNKA
jgi:hypothetical protein